MGEYTIMVLPPLRLGGDCGNCGKRVRLVYCTSSPTDLGYCCKVCEAWVVFDDLDTVYRRARLRHVR